MSKALKLFKETALPETLVADAIYFVQAPNSANQVEVYVTGTDGVARHVINKAEIQALITAAITARSELIIVADIAERNALTLTEARYVLVKSAIGDDTVKSGAATYVYDPAGTTTAAKWFKASEAESLDIQLTWAALKDKPSSAVADIDDAVSKRHSHDNKAKLDKIGEDANGNMTYDGKYPTAGWSTTGW